MEGRPVGVIFSDFSALSLELVGQLIQKNCHVYIVSNHHVKWSETLSTSYGKQVTILTSQDQLPSSPSYVFIISPSSRAIEYANSSYAKTVAILTYRATSEAKRFQELVENENFWKVYVGEIYGRGMVADNDSYVSYVTEALAQGKRIKSPIFDRNLYIAPATQVANEILKGIFSYGFSTNPIVISSKSTVFAFLAEVRKIKPQTTFVSDSGIFGLFENFPITDFLEVRNDWGELASGIEGFTKLKPQPKPVKIKRVVLPKLKKKRKFKINKKFLFGGVFLVLWILILPFLLIAISGGLMKWAYGDIVNGNVSAASFKLEQAGRLASVSLWEANILDSWPVVGKVYTAGRDTSNLLVKTANIASRGEKIWENASGIFKKVLGDEDYDLSGMSDKLYLELDATYKDLGFLETEIGNMKGLLTNFPDFKRIRQLVGGARDFAKRMPVVLGNKNQVTYLVLLQNNMELRPTGGFIGSFALLTFNHGRLSDQSVMDVYSADGQLKGHVEPPAPIKNYLGEANWWLRDSNWDPDFTASAQRAEWFLEKEIDRPVDGVVGIDLEVIKTILKETGEVDLPDFGYKVDYKNVYDKIQHEVEDGFFPGSRKKANVLTALTSSLIDRMMHSQNNWVKLGKGFFDNIESRDIQVYLHDKEAQESISEIGADGSVKAPVCTDCQMNWFGVIEANLGVNKVNYFINRTGSIVSTIENGEVVNRLNINFTNTSTTLPYKNYMRIITMKNSKFDPGVMGEVLLNIAPGESKSMSFTWRNPVTNGQLTTVWRKQAGVPAYPISLTLMGGYKYNTTLDHDIWIPTN